jgi:NAD+ diphosphatase
MLGFTARAVGDPTLRVDHHEIAEAAWFTRDEVRGVGEWGAESFDAVGVLRGLPSTMSIARQLINDWLDRGQ